MRATITIERLSNSFGSYLVGADATKVLAAIQGISAIQIETQFIDRVTLSYESTEARQDFERVDQMLESKGLHRVP
jgi:hypothetical protein